MWLNPFSAVISHVEPGDELAGRLLAAGTSSILHPPPGPISLETVYPNISPKPPEISLRLFYVLIRPQIPIRHEKAFRDLFLRPMCRRVCRYRSDRQITE